MRTRGQDVASVAQNAAFFDENARYAESIATLATYRNIRAAVSTEIAGAERLLDGGNGGVFDYDLGLAPNVVGAVVKDPVQDTVALQEYLESVVRTRSGWSDLYAAIREVL